MRANLPHASAVPALSWVRLRAPPRILPLRRAARRPTLSSPSSSSNWTRMASISDAHRENHDKDRLMKRAVLMVTLLLLSALPVSAQDWPTRTVRIIVPFGPGSTPDLVARLVAERLQQKLGHPFTVENKPGASGNIGTDAVAKAEPDGYTIGVSIGGPLAINPLLFSTLPYDPAKDFAFVTMLATQPSALAVNSGVDASNIGALNGLLKGTRGDYSFRWIGNGALPPLAMDALALKSGTH